MHSAQTKRLWSVTRVEGERCHTADNMPITPCEAPSARLAKAVRRPKGQRLALRQGSWPAWSRHRQCAPRGVRLQAHADNPFQRYEHMLLLERVLTRLESTDGPPPLHQALLAQGIGDLRPFSKTRDVLLSKDRVTKHVLPKMRELEKEGLSPSEARQLLQLGTCLNCSYGNVFAPNLYFLRWVLTAAPTAGRDQVPHGRTLLGGLCLREPDAAVRLLTLPSGRLEVIGWGMLRLLGGSRQQLAALLLERPAALAVRGARDAAALRVLKEQCGLSSEQLLEVLSRHPRLLTVPGPKMAAVLAAAGDLAAAGAPAAAPTATGTAAAGGVPDEQRGSIALQEEVLASAKWIMVPHVAWVLRRLRPLIVGLGWSLGEALLVARHSRRLRSLPHLESHLDYVVEVLRALLGQEQASHLALKTPRMLVQAVEERVRAAAGQEPHAQPLDSSDSGEASDGVDGGLVDEYLGSDSCSGWGSYGSSSSSAPLPQLYGGYPQLSLFLKYNTMFLQPQPGKPTFDPLAAYSVWGAPPLPNQDGAGSSPDGSQPVGLPEAGARASRLWHCPAAQREQPKPAARPLLARGDPATQQAAQALQDALAGRLRLTSEEIVRLMKACPALLSVAPDDVLATAGALVQLLGAAGAKRAVLTVPGLLCSPAEQIEEAVAAFNDALEVERATAVRLLQGCPVLLTHSADQLIARVQQLVTWLGERLELHVGDARHMLRVSPGLLRLDLPSPELDRKLDWALLELGLPAAYLLHTPSALRTSLPRLASRLAFLRSQGLVEGSCAHTQWSRTRPPPKAGAEMVSLPPPRDLWRVLAAPPATFRRWASKQLLLEVGREELAVWEKAWVASTEGRAWMAKQALELGAHQ